VVVGVEAGSHKVKVCYSRSWRPNAANPEENETEIEREVRQAYERYRFQQCRYDPWGLDTVSFRLCKAGVPLAEAVAILLTRQWAGLCQAAEEFLAATERYAQRHPDQANDPQEHARAVATTIATSSRFV